VRIVNRLLFLCLLAILLSISSSAQIKTKVQGFAERGNGTITTQGLPSSNKAQSSFPSSTVTIFDAGTSTLSSIFSNSSGSVKTNPFTASSDGSWFFYGNPGQHYDVRFSGTGITTPFTLGDFVAPTSSIIVANVKTDYGAKGNARISNLASMTSSSSTLTCSDCAFSSLDIGKSIDVSMVGVVDELSGVIVTFNSATSVVLNIAASYTKSSQTVKLDSVTIATGAMVAGSSTLTTGSSFFTADDVGKPVKVGVASVDGPGARNKTGTISSITSSTQAVLSFSASVTTSGRKVIYGSDDGIAIRNAVANNSAIYFPSPSPPFVGYIISSGVAAPPGGLAGILISTSNKTFSGDGRNSSIVYQIGPEMFNQAKDYQLVFITAPATNIDFHDLGFSGTNWYAQFNTGTQTSDAIYISNQGASGGISNISTTSCNFDFTWGIGFHCPGANGGTSIPSPAAINNIFVTNCFARFNSFNGFNPNPTSGLIMLGNFASYNGTAGVESSTNVATFTGNIFIYNFQGGMSIGGFGDPEVANAVTVSGNTCTFNGNYGIDLASNTSTTTLTGNTMRCNGDIGLLADAGSFTLSKNNVVTGNTISSNGRIGMQWGLNDSLVVNNKIVNEGIPGYTQSLGLISVGTRNKYWYNNVKGHPAHDYEFSSVGSTNELATLDSPDIAIDVGVTVTYPSTTFETLIVNNRINLIPMVVSDASINPFIPTVGVALITLTADRIFSSFNGVNGQQVTLIVVQDGVGNHTLTHVSFRGATNIAAGQPAGRVNTQTFMFVTGLGWVATSAAVQNQ